MDGSAAITANRREKQYNNEWVEQRCSAVSKISDSTSVSSRGFDHIKGIPKVGKQRSQYTRKKESTNSRKEMARFINSGEGCVGAKDLSLQDHKQPRAQSCAKDLSYPFAICRHSPEKIRPS